MSPLIQIHSAHKAYGTKVLFENEQVAINEGEHIGLIGPNGAGKSTLVKSLCGEIELDSGQVTRSSQLQLGYLKQEDDWDLNASAIEWVSRDNDIQVWEFEKYAQGLGVSELQMNATIASLSGGFRMRVKLAHLLSRHPNLLLLDEPTNYLDLESLILLESFLQEFDGAFLLISHDREFLRRVTDHTMEVENGQINKFPGHIDDYFEQKEILENLKQKQALNIKQQKAMIIDFANRFRAKATKAKQVQSRLKKLDKLQQIEHKTIRHIKSIPIPLPEKTPKLILQINQGVLGYPEKVVISNVHFSLGRGDHLAVVGRNGAGKSTFLKTLVGKINLLKGHKENTENVRFGYYSQHVAEQLNPKSRIIDELRRAAHPDVVEQDILNIAGALLFSGDDVEKEISILSGGERSRVALGQVLLKKAPCLILDEPTNHLDFYTVEALTKSLKEYPGTIVVVSHERSFIKEIASKILEIRDGQATFYPGTYDEYIWSLQKGGLSHKNLNQNSSAEALKGDETTSPVIKKNYKDQKKKLEKKARELKKNQQTATTEIEVLQQEIDTLTQDLIATSGRDSETIAQTLNLKREALEVLESQWLQIEEDLDLTETELTSLLSQQDKSNKHD